MEEYLNVLPVTGTNEKRDISCRKWKRIFRPIMWKWISIAAPRISIVQLTPCRMGGEKNTCATSAWTGENVQSLLTAAGLICQLGPSRKNPYNRLLVFRLGAKVKNNAPPWPKKGVWSIWNFFFRKIPILCYALNISWRTQPGPEWE